MILGIDLGTTNSLAAIWHQGQVELVPNSFGDYLTPSVVGLSDQGDLIVGRLAKERLMSHPHLTQARFKRYMGTGKPLILGDQSYSPEELSSFILRKLIQDAETYTGQKVEEIIVSVPAYFNDEQRSATKAAGQLAGVKIERIINEPSVAALAIHQNRQEDQTYLVIDFGGGTLDVSIVDAFLNVIEIVSVAGDNYLGGEDFTQLIVHDFYKAWPQAKLVTTPAESAKLYQEADRLKCRLDQETEASFSMTIGPELFTYKLTRERFLVLARPLLQRIEAPIQRAIKDARKRIESIDQVVLVGGNTKMPLVSQYLSVLLKRPIEVLVDQDQAIALGCGLMAGIKARKEDVKDLVLTDICPFTLGLAIKGDIFSPLIERNTVLPSSRVGSYHTTEYGQEEITLNIYQGEQMVASHNHLLGKMIVPVPKNFKNYEAVDVRFSYDINGILEVDVKVLSTGETYHKIFLKTNHLLSEQEIASRLDVLSRLKIHPRETEIYQLLLARVHRLHEESLGEEREHLLAWLRAYEEAMDSQDPRRMDQASQLLERQLNALEAYQSRGYWKDF